MDPLGLDNLTKAVQAFGPVLREALDHASMLGHAVLNRLNGTKFHCDISVEIPPAIGRKPDDAN
jgi:hypothetical protein